MSAAESLAHVESGRHGNDLDEDSVEWVRLLSVDGPDHAGALDRLHQMLLRIARSDARRRAPVLGIAGPELDDLAQQAADDALVAIVHKVGEFRGESRFTTWAYKFVIFEMSGKIGRHFWKNAPVVLDVASWERLPDAFGFDPADEPEWRELLEGLRKAIVDELTEHQRQIFVAVILNGVPLEALAIELDSNRNALYKTVFDARRKLKASLISSGLLDPAYRVGA